MSENDKWNTSFALVFLGGLAFDFRRFELCGWLLGAGIAYLIDILIGIFRRGRVC